MATGRRLLIICLLAFLAREASCQTLESLREDIKRAERDISITNDLLSKTRQNQQSADKALKLIRHKIRTRLDLAEEQIRQLEEKIREAQELKRTDGEVLVLSSGVWFTYGRESLCLLSGVYAKYMKVASPYAMHWKMMQEGIAKGQERYNLYGTSGIFDPDAPDYGVYLFKRGFHADVVELVGDFKCVVAPKINHQYELLHKIKDKLVR